MKKFLNLVNFEFNRFLRFLLPTLFISMLVQFYSTVRLINNYNSGAEHILSSRPGSFQAVIHEMGAFSMVEVVDSGTFTLAILLIVLIFMFYSFFIWYRDWLGKHTFAYRLLMLPLNRTQIFFAKVLVFLIGGVLAFVFQFALMAAQNWLASLLIEAELFISLNPHDIKPTYDMILYLIFPKTLIEFISNYSFAFGALISLFASILMERSYGVKGLVVGVVYFGAYFMIYVLLTSLPYTNMLPLILRPSQFFLLNIAYHFLMIGLGTLISHFLLKGKVKI